MQSAKSMESTPKTNVSFDNTKIAFSGKSKNDLDRAYWLFKLIGNNSLVSLGKIFTNFAIKAHFPIDALIKATIFKQFCGGENISECDKTILELNKYKIGTILDYSVEGKETEKDFNATTVETITTIEKAKNNPLIPFCVFKVTGLARLALLEKINSNLDLSTLHEQEKEEFNRVKERVNRICKKAFDNDIPIFIDSEETWIQEVIDVLADEMMERYNKVKHIVFNTIQMYRHDRLTFLKSSYEKAQKGNYLLGMKIVRGAYMEKERERAELMGYPSPIQPDKESTDRDYDLALRYCIDNAPNIAVCVGTHNENSSLYFINLLEERKIDRDDKLYYFAQLLGMSDHISYNLANAGYNVTKYVPYGPIKEVLPYLIRRAEENTSVAGQIGRELSLIMKEKERRRNEKNN